MKISALALALTATAMLMGATGCMEAPGKPRENSDAARPEQILDAKTLYRQNCAACHGDQGRNGAAISLANPVYLATAGVDNIRRVTRQGVSGTMMPPFGKGQGGLLTDEQIDLLAHGMVHEWARADALSGQAPPAYAAATAGDATRGQQAFGLFCARCHGADGAGTASGPSTHTGSIVDSAYLALISDQGLRSIVIAGRPDRGMPDWRAYLQAPKARAMTDQEIGDVVAWLASHRTQTPGQPYPERK